MFSLLSKKSNSETNTDKDIVQQSISFFNIPIQPCNLDVKHVSKLKNNLDEILSPKLNDPDIAYISREYADAFHQLSSFLCEIKYLDDQKLRIEDDGRKKAVNLVETARKNRRMEFFKYDSEVEDKKREMEANDKKEESELRHLINGWRRRKKMDKYKMKGRNDGNNK